MMNFKNAFVYLCSLILISGCFNQPNNNLQYQGLYNSFPSVTNTAPKQSYLITETFETGRKTRYTTAEIILTTGSWTFDDAIIGKQKTDIKNNEAAARIRNGSIVMNFDVNDITQVTIKHAKYYKDKTSSWQLLASTDGGQTYTQVANDIVETSDTLKTDSFKINITGKVRFEIVKTGSAKINIDDITFQGIGDPGIIAGIVDTVTTDTSISKNKSSSRGITIGPDAPPKTGDNGNLLLGNPSNATANITNTNNYLMDMGYYVESYNNSRGGPNWVSWHLDANNITTTSKRVNNFASFSGLPSSFYPVQNTSYSSTGFDRGHNCPSADRSSSANANSSTFLMTNMIPQAPKNNQQTWGKFENYLRVQVLAGNEIYIIMGSYGKGGTGSKGYFTAINNGKITVPSNIWKVAVIIRAGNNDINRVTNITRVIAIDTPNNNSINPDWTQYIVTVKNIERITGYNLLSVLPKNIQDIVENKIDSGKY